MSQQKYGLNDYGQYFTNQFIPSSTGLGRPCLLAKIHGQMLHCGMYMIVL